MSLLGLSKKCDYALVILSILAKRGEGVVVSAGEMVAEKRLPRAFVSQIGKELVEAGILGSREGKGGGYYLKKRPELVTVKEVLVAVEGKVAPVACLLGKKGCVCDGVCEQKNFMKKLAGEMGRVLASYSLVDVVAN